MRCELLGGLNRIDLQAKTALFGALPPAVEADCTGAGDCLAAGIAHSLSSENQTLVPLYES